MHRPVRSFAAAKVMALYETCKSATLAYADHVHFVVGLEFINQDPITGSEILISGPELELTQKPRSAIEPGFLEMTRIRLVDPLRLNELNNSDLNGVVAIGRGRLAL